MNSSDKIWEILSKMQNFKSIYKTYYQNLLLIKILRLFLCTLKVEKLLKNIDIWPHMLTSWFNWYSVHHWYWNKGKLNKQTKKPSPEGLIFLKSLNEYLKLRRTSFPCGSAGRNLPALRETSVWCLGWKDPSEKGKAIHSSILAWRIPCTL